MAKDTGFAFVLVEELSEGNLVALAVTTPSGKTVHLWSEVELVGRTAILRQFSIYGVSIGRGGLGLAGVRAIAQAAMEEFDVDRIRIESARRTSGANPGRTIKTLEFIR